MTWPSRRSRALGDGPVQVAAGNERTVEKRSGTDRSRLVLGAHEASRRMLPPASKASA